MPTAYQYDCDRCGACCSLFGVNVRAHEVEQVPALAQTVAALEESHRRLGLPLIQSDDKREVFISAGPDFPCSLQADDGSCSIYADRPHVCRAFEPGGSMCQWARGRAGLGMLPWYRVTAVED